MIKNILLLAFIFVLVDAGYLYLMKDNFQTMIKKIQGSSLALKILPTVACYLILVASLYYFIIFKKGTYIDAFLLGFFIYGVYETTNMAIFKNWSITTGILDLTWGGFLFLITTVLYHKMIKLII